MWTYLTYGDGIEALQRAERRIPPLGPRDVVVRMNAVALNYRDLLVINGVGGWKPHEPRVPVSDGAGVVTEVGDDVTRVRVGDRVAGVFLPKWIDGELTAENYVAPLGGPAADGVLTEARVFDEEAVVVVPAHLSDAEAATLPVAAITAWHAIRYRSEVGAGDVVLIQGTGGVSLFSLQFVRALGARAILISSSDQKLERASALGADHLVNYREVPEWDASVLEWTDGRGVDHVIEVVGGENLNRSLRAVRVSGTISFIGLLAGLSAPINTYDFVTKNVRIHGIETGSRAMFESMNAFITEHELYPILDRDYAIDDVGSGLRRVDSGDQFGKVTVRLDG